MRFLIAILFAVQIHATTYYVRTDGNNANNGLANTSGGAKLTFAGAESVATTAGDVVRVQAGTYSEKASITHSGSAGNFRTFVADGAVICRGFTLSGVTYVQFVGIEFTHTDTSIDSVFTVSGTCNHIEFIDLYAHNYYGNFIRASSGTPTLFTFRGCHIYEQGIGTASAFLQTADSAFYEFGASPDSWLLEYNHIHRVGDFANIYGPNHILRNNYLHDADPSYWAASSWHFDMFQPGSDGASLNTRNHVYEANFTGDSLNADGHFAIFQDTVSAGDTNIIVRGNVGFNFGSVFLQILSTDDVNTYNNTAYKVTQSPGNSAFTWYKTGANRVPQNGAIINTIIYDDGAGTDAILVQDGNNVTVANNIGYQAGTEASYVSTSDPLFVDATNKDFRIQSGSAARAAGRAVTTVSSSTGSGTSFTVPTGTAKYFTDGKGLVAGDVIRVGSTNATRVRITSISNDTITVDTSISWNNGDTVYWGDHGLDIGAFPFYFQPLTSATLTQNGSDWTVTPNGDMRFAMFYLDGIPYAQVMSTNPRAALTQTMPAGTVTVKTYALYAQETPVVNATFIPSTMPTGRAHGKGKKGL